MTRDQLIAAVKVKMEELTPFNEGVVVLASSSNVKPITSYIDATLNEASDEALMILPLHLITPSVLPGSMSGANGIGSLELPDDFLRLYALKVSTWQRDVCETISETHPAYALQRNPYTRGKSEKPVAVILHDGTKKKLECYSVTGATPTVEKKLYVKRVAAEANPANLLIYVIYLCAIKVYATIERPDMAKVMTDQLAELIKIQQQ